MPKTPVEENLSEMVADKLRWLRLPGMAAALESVLQHASQDNLSPMEVVSRLCDEEKQSRMRSAVNRRIQDARFPEINTIDGFDFDYSPARKKLRAAYLALHDLDFLDQGVNALFIGAPGTGKTFLARALAYKACLSNRRVVFTSATGMLNELHGADLHGDITKALRKYVRAEFLAIDDFASLSMDVAHARLAFQVISERYEHRRAIAITTNRPFKDWTKVFPDALNAQIIAERLIDRAQIFNLLNDKGYRKPRS